jgi:hypothetical protein
MSKYFKFRLANNDADLYLPKIEALVSSSSKVKEMTLNNHSNYIAISLEFDNSEDYQSFIDTMNESGIYFSMSFGE